jgi:hypothetical protein
LCQRRQARPQGAVASPLLANIHLHYVFDLWADRWRKRHARGQVNTVRYAGDMVMGFEYEGEQHAWWQICGSEWKSSRYRCIRKKQDYLSLAVVRPNDECVVVLASRRHLNSLDLLTSVADPVKAQIPRRPASLTSQPALVPGRASNSALLCRPQWRKMP